ncbi:nuclear transport factor 2 family protein [Mucilaginibacter limnophilus]|uniref:Nuclear transport factor 2 family protein n=1 Tax=Mucilaginibacter limnophilus TaxID=1932778 RepID=A0A437MUE2_9SPHI|nr:nuclear transport factor 2 family protein [Mucilaginibacter limnophilus]RVU01281.1 nuclear transport factor 2 family protein [Mucilaginibacter limnophilus]
MDQHEIEKAVEVLRKAMITSDEASFNKLASDKLTYGHSGGKMQNKAQFIESFVSGASVFVSIDISEQQITIQDNTAIVRHILSAETNDKGKAPAPIKLHILLVWVKAASGHWQLLARQAVKAS